MATDVAASPTSVQPLQSVKPEIPQLQDEVQSISNKLDKLITEKNAGSAEAVELLMRLEKSAIDLNILQNTNVGKSVNTLRKETKNEQVATICKNLVKSWKSLLKVGGNTASADGSPPSATDSPAQIKGGTGKPAPKRDISAADRTQTQSEPERKRSKGPSPSETSLTGPTTDGLASQNNVTDVRDRSRSRSSSSNSINPSSPKNGSTASGNGPTGPAQPHNVSISTKDSPVSKTSGSGSAASKSGNGLPFPLSASTVNTATTDAFRLKSRELIVKALTKDGVLEDARDPSVVAAELESFVFKEFNAVDQRYKNRIRSRIINLQDSRNPRLRENVVLGVISCQRFANMSSEEMASDEMKTLREKYTKEAINDHQMATTAGTETDLLQCGKCKQRKCTYNQVQTRSADEPMTTFVYCNNCGNRWKFC